MKRIMLPDFGGGGGQPAPADHDYGNVLGAPFAVFLKNGVTRLVDQTTGKTMVDITDLPGLVAATVRSRVLHPRKLSPADLKFLRSALAMKSKHLAKMVELTPEFYSRCETGQKIMSGPTEKMFRTCAFLLSYRNHKDIRDFVKGKTAAEKTLRPEEAQKVLTDIKRLFFDMKISAVFEVEDGELSFTFTRRCPDDGAPCGDEDEKWDNELKAA
jgi:DNA-binding transcriptional regulator YiaG